MYCFRNEQVGRSMDKIGWCNTSVMRADNVDNNARVVTTTTPCIRVRARASRSLLIAEI